jgi:hypothetical protein
VPTHNLASSNSQQRPAACFWKILIGPYQPPTYTHHLPARQRLCPPISQPCRTPVPLRLMRSLDQRLTPARPSTLSQSRRCAASESPESGSAAPCANSTGSSHPSRPNPSRPTASSESAAPRATAAVRHALGPVSRCAGPVLSGAGLWPQGRVGGQAGGCGGGPVGVFLSDDEGEGREARRASTVAPAAGGLLGFQGGIGLGPPARQVPRPSRPSAGGRCRSGIGGRLAKRARNFITCAGRRARRRCK